MSPQSVTPKPAPDAQARLASAVQALRGWQVRQDRLGANRHGRCLEAVRAAVTAVGLALPAPQPRPHNLALSNWEALRHDPSRWGWIAAPADARYTLDYFDHVGRLPDGRVAGHVAVTDRQNGVLYSSWDYSLSSYWQANRVGSFVPMFERAGAATGAGGGKPSEGGVTRSPYLDAEVVDGATIGVLHRLPGCVLLASDGHAYLRATALAEATDEPWQVNDAHHDGLLILRKGVATTR